MYGVQLAKGPPQTKAEINVGAKLAIFIIAPHPPVVLPKSAWPHAFTVAFTISNDQQSFGEPLATMSTSTN
jgi:hypothetical protein